MTRRGPFQDLERLIRDGLILLARAYQVALSPLMGGQCRFEPTCSNYFIEAVRKRGALRGTLMGIRRILRCNPWCKGGYDPVEAPGLGDKEQPSSRR